MRRQPGRPSAIDRGRYRDPRATEHLVKTLIERRDEVVRRWVPAGAATGGN